MENIPSSRRRPEIPQNFRRRSSPFDSEFANSESKMRVCGIICEYDPFHNGHAYHIQCVRKQSACEYVVCVMSGHFTQRGQPALLSKWARAEMALSCGADVVFELPTLFAVRDAERFARGGVDLLNALGVITDIGFGAESGDLNALRTQAAMTEDRDRIKAGLSRGETLARARSEAIGSPAMPNDILATEYLRAIEKSQSTINPIVILRKGGAYHDPALHSYASATGIRQALRNGIDVKAAMPEAAYQILRGATALGEVQRPDGLDTALFYLLRTINAERLAQVADVSEGLESRILREAMKASSREALLEAVKCKRYTWARLSRILTQALLGITKDVVLANPAPSYARLLGFRQSARPLLSAIKKSCAVPIITRTAKASTQPKDALSIDLAASDIWSLGLMNPSLCHGGRDLTTRVRIL